MMKYKIEPELLNYKLFECFDTLLKEYNKVDIDFMDSNVLLELKETYRTFYDLYNLMRFPSTVDYNEEELVYIARAVYAKKGLSHGIILLGNYFGFTINVADLFSDTAGVTVTFKDNYTTTSLDRFEFLLKKLFSELVYYNSLAIVYNDIKLLLEFQLEVNIHSNLQLINEKIAGFYNEIGDPL